MVLDDFDGDVIDNIEITETLNLNNIGTYILTYTVTDKSGNMSD